MADAHTPSDRKIVTILDSGTAIGGKPKVLTVTTNIYKKRPPQAIFILYVDRVKHSASKSYSTIASKYTAL